MSLAGIFTRLPTSIVEKFHYQTFFLQLRNHSTYFSDIGHWSNLTLCYVSSLTINIKNIYSHSIFLILQFLTFSVHLEMQNYKFYLTNSLGMRHLTFQGATANTLSGHSIPGLLKSSFIFVALFLIPFHSDLWILA